MQHRPLLLGLLVCLVLSTQAQTTKRYHGDGIDDALQYVPYAAAAGLKALGVESQSAWPQLAFNVSVSYALNAGITYSLKHTVHSRRPDGTDRRSFPSGHAAIAFAGATIVHHEYGREHLGVSIAAYSIAALTAADRVRRNRHHVADVVAGAAIGVLSTEATYWLNHRLWPRNRNVQAQFAPQGLQLVVML